MFASQPIQTQRILDAAAVGMATTAAIAIAGRILGRNRRIGPALLSGAAASLLRYGWRSYPSVDAIRLAVEGGDDSPLRLWSRSEPLLRELTPDEIRRAARIVGLVQIAPPIDSITFEEGVHSVRLLGALSRLPDWRTLEAGVRQTVSDLGPLAVAGNGHKVLPKVALDHGRHCRIRQNLPQAVLVGREFRNCDMSHGGLFLRRLLILHAKTLGRPADDSGYYKDSMRALWEDPATMIARSRQDDGTANDDWHLQAAQALSANVGAGIDDQILKHAVDYAAIVRMTSEEPLVVDRVRQYCIQHKGELECRQLFELCQRLYPFHHTYSLEPLLDELRTRLSSPDGLSLWDEMEQQYLSDTMADPTAFLGVVVAVAPQELLVRSRCTPAFPIIGRILSGDEGAVAHGDEGFAGVGYFLARAARDCPDWVVNACQRGLLDDSISFTWVGAQIRTVEDASRIARALVDVEYDFEAGHLLGGFAARSNIACELPKSDRPLDLAAAAMEYPLLRDAAIRSGLSSTAGPGDDRARFALALARHLPSDWASDDPLSNCIVPLWEQALRLSAGQPREDLAVAIMDCLYRLEAELDPTLGLAQALATAPIRPMSSVYHLRVRLRMGIVVEPLLIQACKGATDSAALGTAVGPIIDIARECNLHRLPYQLSPSDPRAFLEAIKPHCDPAKIDETIAYLKRCSGPLSSLRRQVL